MSNEQILESLNPVGEDEIAAWSQQRQNHVWAQVLEQTQGDGALILGELAPASTQRGLRLAIAVAVLLPALIVGLVLSQLSDSPSENSPIVGTAVPIDIEVPLTMELPTSGAIWVADASLDREQAARAFALEAFGWDEGVELSTDEDPSGPSWITMTRSSVSITALFAPIVTTTKQWTLIALGQGGPGFTLDLNEGKPEAIVISRGPVGTVSIVVHIADGNETTSTFIEDINSSNLRLPLDGWPWVEVVVFVDVSGQAIGAVAGENGFTPSSPSSVATTAPSPARPQMLSSEQVVCMYGTSDAIGTTVSDTLMGQPMDIEILIAECRDGNDLVIDLEISPDTFTVCLGSYNDSYFEEILAAGDASGIDVSIAPREFLVVLDRDVDCADAVFDNKFQMTLAPFVSFDEINRIREIEIDVMAESRRRCLSRSEAEVLAQETLERLGDGWQLFSFSDEIAEADDCFGLNFQADLGFVSVEIDYN